jgi:hypothetical protein
VSSSVLGQPRERVERDVVDEARVTAGSGSCDNDEGVPFGTYGAIRSIADVIWRIRSSGAVGCGARLSGNSECTVDCTELTVRLLRFMFSSCGA